MRMQFIPTGSSTFSRPVEKACLGIRPRMHVPKTPFVFFQSVFIRDSTELLQSCEHSNTILLISELDVCHSN